MQIWPGSPRAVAHWNDCYEYLTPHYRFARKVALVGLSRGGLYCYNWAVSNPEKVACIYGGAPVCDLKSWPGGKGKGPGSPRDWQLAMQQYGFANEAEALAYPQNPIDQLEPLAKAGVPLLHVYGDADEVVPWSENTRVIAQRYPKLGGKITLIAKAGIGHHPHGLDDSTPIIEFIARNSPGTPQEFVDAALLPIWQTTRITEPLLFLRMNPAQPPTASLLFAPQKIESVTSGQRDIIYVEGMDYVLEVSNPQLSLPNSSRIAFKKFDELYPLTESKLPQIARQAGDKSRGIFFDNESEYHRLQVAVTYLLDRPAWTGPRPTLDTNALVNTRAKLQRGDPVSIFLCGDSISEGYNASKFTQAAPYCASYGELVALALEQRYGNPITYRNFAIGGWNSAQGLTDCRDRQLGQKSPDLVIIAFGMNDVFQQDARKFQSNVAGIIETIRKDSPESEFVLVASMLGNKDWGMPMDQFSLYRSALRKLSSPQVVLVDMQAVWEELLRRKTFYDLTGNGVNHPNDFGHTLYAQWILSQLVPEMTQ